METEDDLRAAVAMMPDELLDQLISRLLGAVWGDSTRTYFDMLVLERDHRRDLYNNK